jgi:hypothetical protein
MRDYIKQLEEQNEELQKTLAKEQSDNELMKVDHKIFTTMMWHEHTRPTDNYDNSGITEQLYNLIVRKEYVWCSPMFDVANVFFDETRKAWNIHYYSPSVCEDVIDFSSPERARAHVEKKFCDKLENLRESKRRA